MATAEVIKKCEETLRKSGEAIKKRREELAKEGETAKENLPVRSNFKKEEDFRQALARAEAKENHRNREIAKLATALQLIEDGTYRRYCEEIATRLESAVAEQKKTHSNLPTLKDCDSEPSYRQELDKAEALIRRCTVERKELELALRRIESGTFGFCKLCDKLIPEERLNAYLTAQTCCGAGFIKAKTSSLAQSAVG